MVGCSLIAVVILLKRSSASGERLSSLHLTVRSQGDGRTTLTRTTEILTEYCTAVNLKRFDESRDSMEVSYLVSVDGYQKLEQAKAALQEKDRDAEVSFLDNQGAF